MAMEEDLSMLVKALMVLLLVKDLVLKQGKPLPLLLHALMNQVMQLNFNLRKIHSTVLSVLSITAKTVQNQELTQ
mgnify:CR=1 FL=1